MMRPKSAPVRSEPYRRLVACLPCSNCRILGFSQTAHGPTLGGHIKCDDRLTFPLCIGHGSDGIGCHVRYDQYMLGDKHWRHEQAAIWAAQTQRDVLAMKQCTNQIRQLLESL